MSLPLDLLPEISDALNAGRPVVALESTIVSHGMPHPRNIETAEAVEAAVRDKGAVPATIAVLDGRIKVGITKAQLERIGDPESREMVKLSRANLAGCLAGGGSGSTTVAATMIAAHLAGIEVFATGGIGGVHKGAETSFDISADLHELAQTPVMVVCAGAKAILDIPKTLEVLETLGVPVMTYGQGPFPAFWSCKSGYGSPSFLMKDAPEVPAKGFAMQRRLGLKAGMLLANPIPAEDEIPPEVINPHIAQAVAEADAAGIGHGAVTPYILKRIFELTEGRSLEANVALVLNNARLAARVAGELVRM